MKTKVVIIDQHLKIYVEGILHLLVAVPNISSIQSYRLSDHQWMIEILCGDGNNIELSYVTKDMWKRILKELDKLKLF